MLIDTQHNTYLQNKKKRWKLSDLIIDDRETVSRSILDVK